MQERRYSTAENASKESLKLKEGEAYTLIFIERPEEGKKRVKIKKRMRLMKCYRHHAVFEDKKGYSILTDTGISRNCSLESRGRKEKICSSLVQDLRS